VRPVHTIKVPYADQRRTEVSRDVVEFVKNLHDLCGAGAPARERPASNFPSTHHASNPAPGHSCLARVAPSSTINP
jgi:hypothetical protein